ncbi:hypothetical protein [Acidipropionibacterium timonense]|uniref:hypothetical protein n=1 Tax=Acidipropionibacterium timonense TaxID=2161818 RepID=UPI00102F89C1|nr:hypothetical protein [Acidipropionibacterium timonense]
MLHTTEGRGWTDYGSGSMCPTLTLNCTSGRPQWRQHLPLPHSARALRQPTSGPITNRLNVVQVELVGTGGWATAANPHRPYTIDSPHTDWTDPDQVMVDALADFLRWLHDEWPVPLVAPYPFGDWTGNYTHRMTTAEWQAFHGICGHGHVPGQDHTDPGSLPIARIIAAATGTKPTTTTPTETTVSTTTQEDTMHGCYYRDGKTVIYLIFDAASGWWHEFGHGKGGGPMSASYVNPIASGWGTGSWPEITPSHASVIKASLDRVRTNR